MTTCLHAPDALFRIAASIRTESIGHAVRRKDC